jgi:hypothetical protein
MLKNFKSKLKEALASACSPLYRTQERQIILQALLVARQNRKLLELQEFADVEFSAFSQWGEDGIIDWLISKIPGIPKTFVEFGVENYREANTRLLIQLRNWRGLVIDGSSRNIQDIRGQDISWRHQLLSLSEFITRNNINQLICGAGIKGEIGLLSIDIDGIDFWVWQSITTISPAIVVCEYNAVFGDLYSVTVPYRDDFDRTKAHHSNLYFGASLPALIYLAREKGYTFIGTCTAGVNAFFVRNDIAFEITKCIRSISAYPSKFRESRDPDGELLFLDGVKRSELICDCPLVNVVSGDLTTIREMGSIYGQQWMVGDRRIF